MSSVRVLIVVLLAGIIGVVGFSLVPPVSARTGQLSYHTAATLVCSQCHTMHYSEGGQPPGGADTGGPFPKLLLKKNVTDLCLTCHGAGGSGPNVMSGSWPAGSFSNSATYPGTGHNPTGTSDNQSTQIPIDSTLGLTPPGSTGGALTEFTCATCHDRHGDDAFTYRLLRKHIKGPGGSVVDVSNTIVSTFADEQSAETESETNHNVYRSPAVIKETSQGFSAWCASCHGSFHKTAASNLRHPTAKQLGGLYQNYTAQNTSDGYAGGTYHYKYPVETNQGQIATTDSQWSITSGDTERVFCLTCHRAHASPYANAGRWDFAQPSGPGTGCNKCHARGR